MNNQAVYQAGDVVKDYCAHQALQPPEETILQLFHDQWSGMKFLDIGVGAGRTAGHFGPRVQEYFGVDYSKPMIEACRARFGAANGRMRFAVCDARQMGEYDAQSFDFVLFSYNGIDYVSHEDRLQVLRQIRRVLKVNGHFFFSSHNIQYLPMLFRVPRNPFKPEFFKRLRKWLALRRHNSYLELRKQKYAVLKDGSNNFQSEQYYIAPGEQIGQLESSGFSHVRYFSILNGCEIKDRIFLARNQEAWVYYLCQPIIS
jgi:ubiquinone/menaquinone biosynthesis C-methylase UbiE